MKTSSVQALAAIAAFVALATPAVAHQTADRIWSGGSILTMNDKSMRAEAVAESGGRIVAVGSRADWPVVREPGPD